MTRPVATKTNLTQSGPVKHSSAYQSWPTTNKAQNMVPCANQYAGHAHLKVATINEIKPKPRKVSVLSCWCQIFKVLGVGRWWPLLTKHWLSMLQLLDQLLWQHPSPESWRTWLCFSPSSAWGSHALGLPRWTGALSKGLVAETPAIRSNLDGLSMCKCRSQRAQQAKLTSISTVQLRYVPAVVVLVSGRRREEARGLLQ